MQLPRVVIAAVFFVIGAMIAVPALVDVFSEDATGSPAASANTTSASPTTTDGGSADPSPSGTSSAEPSPSKSSDKPTPQPKRKAPLTAGIGKVRCPDAEVRVTVRNRGTTTVDYAIETNAGGEADPGRIGPGASRTTTVDLREDRRTRIRVTWNNNPVESWTRTARCRDGGGGGELPSTGPGDVIWSRAAFGAAAMVTGVIIFWYGGVWPRRKEQIFAKKSRG